jgi:hypothetical protein
MARTPRVAEHSAAARDSGGRITDFEEYRSSMLIFIAPFEFVAFSFPVSGFPLEFPALPFPVL